MHWVAGIDEAGRGPIAGPVVAACVILPENHQIAGIADSKTLSEHTRTRLFDLITARAVAWSIGLASPAEIDEMNILQASLLAMRRALERLTVCPAEVWIDGPSCLQACPYPQKAVVKGDAKHEVIGAASILAKETRDRMMKEYDRLFPGYDFARHKGYPTPFHLQQIVQKGVCTIHRRTYAPVAHVLGTDLRQKHYEEIAYRSGKSH
jgi:ribonuclease HII